MYKKKWWIYGLLFCNSLLIGTSAQTQDIWRPKAQATDFVADWSQADQRDAEASAYFLQTIWPGLQATSERLTATLKTGTRSGYAGPLTPQEQAAGAVTFWAYPEEIVPWNLIPSPEQVAVRQIKTFAARGESRAIGIVVHALQPLFQVDVITTDLHGPETIAASHLTSRLSLSYTIDPHGHGEAAIRQMLLLKVAGWDLPQTRTGEWIVDVHVPVDAQAGTYRGKIILTTYNHAFAEFDLELEVLPFRLTDNGCRWGAFMTPSPAYVTDAWGDLNARYGFNSLAWWYLDEPPLTWTWEGYYAQILILAKLRDAQGTSLTGEALQNVRDTMPAWLKSRIDGPYLYFTPEEIEGYWALDGVRPLPEDLSPTSPAYKKPLKIKSSLGELSAEIAPLICFDRPGARPNFTAAAINTVQFREDLAFQQLDAGMQRLTSYGFVGPLTWFSAGKNPSAWETRVVSQRFGQQYTRSQWKWQRAVTPHNTNHLWYLANAAIARTFADARARYGWPEVVWCPHDESLEVTGESGRSVANMIGEMMPYIRQYAPQARIYAVVWQTKEDNWRSMWQCGVLQKFANKQNSAGALTPSPRYGPFQVISTNCPNALDRQTTWEAGGEYWLYALITSTSPAFIQNRFKFGFWGAMHSAAVMYNFADSSGPANESPMQDWQTSLWLTGKYTLNYYLARDPNQPQIDYALASHAMLACRAGIIDRKYVETLRTWAYYKQSVDDLQFIHTLPERIQRIEQLSRESSSQAVYAFEQLRREIADRLKKLVTS